MTELLDDYKEQIEDIFEEIRNGLKNVLPSITNGTERVEKCKYYKQRLQRIGVIRKSMFHELSDLSNPSEKKSWEQIINGFEGELTTLQQELLEAESLPANLAGKPITITSKDMTTAALKIQEQSKASTKRTKAAVDNIINIGTDITTDLQMQTEQLQRIEGETELLEGNLKRADVQVRIIMRNLQKDKLFLTMFLIMLIVIIIAIIVVIFMTKSDDKKYIKEGEGI